MRLLLVVTGILAAAAAALPGVASALTSTPCARQATFRCATLTVPLDRTGAVAGTIPLKVAYQRGSKPVLVALTGGPGQGGVAFATSFSMSLAPAMGRYRLAVLDQRGTGGSGLLKCPALQQLTTLAPFTPQAVADCAALLGPRRAFYATVDTVDDLEALRVALKVPKLALMGVSYGTYVATQYARIHPDRVDRLILDSAVGPDGVDPFALDTFARLPRVLRSLCSGGACQGATDDLYADLATVAARLEGSDPVAGTVRDGRGRARRVALTGTSDLIGILTSGDLNPGVVALLPGALRAAAAGDDAPLARLREIADGTPVAATDLSIALNAATSCEDIALPYGPADPPDARQAGSQAALAAIPPASYAPFSARTVGESGYPGDCEQWPGSPAWRTPSHAPLPDVPTLILGGDLDTRTPIENARELAALLPRAAVVEVPGNGHDELDTDYTGCAVRALGRFIRDVAIGTPCAGASDRPRIAGRPPLHLADVAGTRGVPGVRGRIVTATLDTVADAIDMYLARANAGLSSAVVTRGGGLRGGRFTVDPRTLRLDRAVYVPGVRVTGSLLLYDDGSYGGPLRIDGPGTLDGTLTVTEHGLQKGRLGGRSVRALARVRRGQFPESFPAPALAPPLPLLGGRGKVHSVVGSLSHGE